MIMKTGSLMLTMTAMEGEINHSMLLGLVVVMTFMTTFIKFHATSIMIELLTFPMQ